MTDDLAALRRDLEGERARLLTSLKEARNGLTAERQRTADTISCQPIIAFEIMIAILERENFLTTSVERLPVVLCQLENRLCRLVKFLKRLRIEQSAPSLLSFAESSGHWPDCANEVSNDFKAECEAALRS